MPIRILRLKNALPSFFYIFFIFFLEKANKCAIFFISSERVSEGLLFNTISTIFQLYHGENKLIFNEMWSALY